MKFCKSLQRIAATSDPSYAPYWTNYKLLKKLIKAISGHAAAAAAAVSSAATNEVAPPTPACLRTATARAQEEENPPHPLPRSIRSDPREVAFFQLLHAEVKKATGFFDKVTRECQVREQLVRVAMEILQRPSAATVRDGWSVLARAIFRLYRDLLLLETFGILTYVSCSKILKKHDKVTGYQTRDPFMVNIVHPANFYAYPQIMEMIRRCEALYQQASAKLLQELPSDERASFLTLMGAWNRRHDPEENPAEGRARRRLPHENRSSEEDPPAGQPPPMAGPVPKRRHENDDTTPREEERSASRREESSPPRRQRQRSR